MCVIYVYITKCYSVFVFETVRNISFADKFSFYIDSW